jgi:hypothetical protein
MIVNYKFDNLRTVKSMFDAVESLVLDLLEWVADGERSHDEVMDAWRTACPRFPVWEEANNRKLIARLYVNGRTIVKGHADRHGSSRSKGRRSPPEIVSATVL